MNAKLINQQQLILKFPHFREKGVQWVHYNIVKPIGFFTIRKSDPFLSGYLTDLKNPQPPDHHFNALPTELGGNLL